MYTSDLNYKKATQAINYIASQQRNNIVNKMKAIKLIWLADRYHIRKYGRPVIGDYYLAMENGPVGSIVRDIANAATAYLEPEELEYRNMYLKADGKYSIKSINHLDDDVFSDTDIEALTFVLENFGKMNEFELVELSHKYPEWARFEEQLKYASRQSMSYKDFFLDPTNISDDKFRQNEKLTDAAKEIFLEESSVICG